MWAASVGGEPARRAQPSSAGKRWKVVGGEEVTCCYYVNWNSGNNGNGGI